MPIANSAPTIAACPLVYQPEQVFAYWLVSLMPRALVVAVIGFIEHACGEVGDLLGVCWAI
ncbi:MAG: hypothetical protein R2735_01620 [Microthrixaceae bacterium]